MDLFLSSPLVLVASKCIDIINDQTPTHKLEVLRSTLILAAKGLYHQRQNHYLAEALFRVIRGRMRPQELSLLKDSMKFDHADLDVKGKMAQAVRSHWPVSIVKRIEDMDSHILTKLVESYGNLNVGENEEASGSEQMKT
jgi:hypothetical protein